MCVCVWSYVSLCVSQMTLSVCVCVCVCFCAYVCTCVLYVVVLSPDSSWTAVTVELCGVVFCCVPFTEENELP